jgi:hypothetical protein
MNDTIATRMDIAGDDAGIPPQLSIGDHETAKANGSSVYRSPSEARVPPLGCRGAWRSWLPGAWGDPF